MKFKLYILMNDGNNKANLVEKEAHEWGAMNGVFICKSEPLPDSKPGLFKHSFMVPLDRVIQVQCEAIEERIINPQIG